MKRLNLDFGLIFFRCEEAELVIIICTVQLLFLCLLRRQRWNDEVKLHVKRPNSLLDAH